ncbi:hypothetical protein CASFOL_026500 [Castilleja foliolosa]|uniref:F-box domain-containing protein n=1 Tax=Castilleja foliolosa TaxID=1961234 RepID=A0ABD3CH86_9LAMI
MDNIPPSIIRLPPPPPPLIPADLKEGEINPEMVGSNNRSTHTYYLSKWKRLTDIESLPEEVLFDVLVRLQAQDIYDSARLVCSKWYHMIHTHTFIYAHLQHSTYGLLFKSTSSGALLFMAVGKSGRVEISKLSYKLRGPLMVGCNGLLLEVGENEHNFNVSNPATRQVFALPPFVAKITHYELFGVVYAAASMEYKVVIIARWGKRMYCIFTIGVDNSWRTVGSSLDSQECIITPLITEGFLHFYDEASNEVVTLNAETEIITKTSCPNPRGYRRNFLLSTGRYLSLLLPCGEFCWEVWEMKPKIDYQWRKVWDISLKAHKCTTLQQFVFKKYYYLKPVGWLKYLEVLVFEVFDVYDSSPSQKLVFNLLTQEIDTIKYLAAIRLD